MDQDQAEATADRVIEALLGTMGSLDEAIENDTIDELVNSSYIILNDFEFCKDHGDECCEKCEADTRLNNNNTLPPHIFNVLSKTLWAGIDPIRRTPISDVYTMLNPVSTGKKHPTRRHQLYACPTHRAQDCKSCFNWVAILKGKTPKKDSATDRQQVLGMLQSMGVVFSTSTKLPDEALEKKLSAALTASQSLISYPNGSVDPEKLSSWTGTGDASALEAMNRTSITEALMNQEARLSGGLDPFPLFKDAFMDARQTSRHLARNFEQGMSSMVMCNQEDTHATCIRILSIHKIDDKTPLISLLYESRSSSTHQSVTRSNEWILQLSRANSGKVTIIHSTVEEQALFQRLLVENGRRLSSSFKPTKTKYETNFKPSFVVPIASLSQIDVGKLTYNAGCVVCGTKISSRCAQCQSVTYCGAVCQKAHWSEHKAMCKSLKGGKWIPLRMNTKVEVDGQSMYVANLSNHGQIAGDVIPEDIPPNIHGEFAFVVKLQRPLSNEESNRKMPPMIENIGLNVMMVYDRQRSFRAYVAADKNPGMYEETVAQILMSQNRQKIYRWAKRVGEYDLSVCLDREPVPLPTW